MSQILEGILEEFNEDIKELKKLNDKYANAKEEAEKEEAKKNLDTKKDLVKSKVMERAKSSGFSKEVAERRSQRKKATILADINNVEGKIEMSKLEIADIDEEIEKLRKAE